MSSVRRRRILSLKRLIERVCLVFRPYEYIILKTKTEEFHIWIEKTKWVQEQKKWIPTARAGEHIADVLHAEIDRLRAELVNATSEFRYGRMGNPEEKDTKDSPPGVYSVDLKGVTVTGVVEDEAIALIIASQEKKA